VPREARSAACQFEGREDWRELPLVTSSARRQDHDDAVRRAHPDPNNKGGYRPAPLPRCVLCAAGLGAGP
jgi:hypothetical protein